MNRGRNHFVSNSITDYILSEKSTTDGSCKKCRTREQNPEHEAIRRCSRARSLGFRFQQEISMTEISMRRVSQCRSPCRRTQLLDYVEGCKMIQHYCEQPTCSHYQTRQGPAGSCGRTMDNAAENPDSPSLALAAMAMAANGLQ